MKARIFGAAMTALGIVPGTGAQAQVAGCAFPAPVDLGSDTAAAWEKLTYAADIQTYQLCALEAFANNPKRVRFPGEDKMLASYRAAHKQTIRMLKARASFPGDGRVLSRSQANTELQRSGRDYALFYQFSEGLYWSENCGETNCPQRDDLEAFAASLGVDPRAEAARIAREGRGVAMEPWFLLGLLKIERKSTDVTGQSLKSAFEAALFAHEQALDDLSVARRVLNEAIEARDEVMDPLKAAQRKRLNALNEVLGQYRLDPAVVREGSAYKAASARIARAERRMLQIDQAISHLVEQRGEEAFGQARIAELRAERDGERARVDMARAEREALLTPELPPDVAAKARQMRREVADGQADLNRTGAYHEARISRAEARVHVALAASDTTSEARDTARRALGKWSDNLRLMRITSVTTEHARLVEATEEELARFQTQLDKVRAEVRARKDKLRGLNDARGKARVEMLRAANAANEANIALANAGFLSHLAQANVEMAFAAYDLVKSLELGPAGLAAQVTKIYVLGFAYPPTYYDAASKTLSEYGLGRAPPRSTEILDVYEHLSLRPAAETLSKQFYSMPFKRVLTSLEASAAKVGAESGRATFMDAAASLSSAETSRMVEAVWKYEENLATATKELAEMTGKAGKAAFVKSAAVSFGKDILKGIGKEVAKKGMAEIIEGGFLEDYMLAQMDLAQAVAKMRHAGSLYWANHDAVTVLEAMLDGLERRQAEITNLVDERNEPFYVDGGYRIELQIADEEQVVASRLGAELSLGGVPLKRVVGTGTLIWSVPPRAEDRFGHDQPERLPLVLTLP